MILQNDIDYCYQLIVIDMLILPRVISPSLAFARRLSSKGKNMAKNAKKIKAGKS